MRLQRFPAGVKPLESDLNSLSDNALDGIQDLISVFSGTSSGSVLFDATAPITDVTDDVLTVTTPSQRVSVTGAVETSADYFETFDVSSTDRYVEIFFVISRNPVTATRNFLSLDTDSGSTILQNMEAEIAEITNIRVMYLTQSTLPGAANGLVPALNANDLGYARLGSVSHDRNNATTTFVGDPTFVFRLPVDIAAGDPVVIPPVNGQESGLMTPQLYSMTLTALQEVTADSDSPFLSFAGTTSPAGLRGVSASLATGEGLTVDQNGLAPDFLVPTAANGQTTKVARADHIHALSQSGIVRVAKSFALTSNSAGSLQELTITSADLPSGVNLATIMSIELMWGPNPNDPGRVQLGWTEASGGGTVGARAYVSSNTRLHIEIGNLGVLALGTPGARSLVEDWMGGLSADTYPSTGTVYVNILGLREGANG